MALVVLELCAGGGGQAIGLEAAGFECAAAVEIDGPSCETLRLNRPQWRVIQSDIREVSGSDFRGIDLVAGGVPCPPFSIAGKQLGHHDERDLFPEALRIIEQSKPSAVLLENVPGFASPRFKSYRQRLASALSGLGYEAHCKILNACDYAVPQLRPRFIIVALRKRAASKFVWPECLDQRPPTVGEAIGDLMASRALAGRDSLGEQGKLHKPDNRWWIKETRRPRPWSYAGAPPVGSPRR